MRIILVSLLMLWCVGVRAAHPLPTGGQVYQWGTSRAGSAAALAKLTNAVQVSANMDWVMALKEDGTIVNWGSNWCGTNTPPAGNYTYICAGWYHGLAITNGGSVVQWVDPVHADAGWSSPPATGTYTQVSGGDHHSAALRSDGVVVTWGDDSCNWARANNGVYSNAQAIASMWYAVGVLHSNSTVSTFGLHLRASTGGYITPPAGLTNVVALEGGRFTFTATKSDGTVVVWGYPDTGYQEMPAGVSNIAAAVSGQNYTLAYDRNGVVKAWGTNTAGQLNIPPGLGVAAQVDAIGSTSFAIQGIPETGGIDPPEVSSVRYVRKDGSDSNSGWYDTAAGAFLTIGQAMQDATPGTTIYLGAGTWDEDVNTDTGGTASSRIVLDGRNVATVKRISVDNPYWTLRNVTFSGYTNVAGNLISVRGGAHGLIVTGCTIDGNDALKVNGINWQQNAAPRSDLDASDCVISNNVVTRILGATCIGIAGDRNLITRNTLKDSGAVDFFRLWGRTNVISDNVCTNNYYTEGTGNHPDFIQTFGNNGHLSFGHVIERNFVVGIYGGQVTQLEGNMLPEIRDWTFRNNVFSDIALQGSGSIPGVAFLNNTFFRVNRTNGGHAFSYGDRVYTITNAAPGYSAGTNFAHNCTVLNNAFIQCGDDSNNSGWYSFDNLCTNIWADFNFVSIGDAFEAADTDGTMRTNGAAGGWSLFDWYELNGINGGDPRMVSLSGGNFRLQSDSPLIGRGTTAAGSSLDADSYPRDGTPDIGAYEYVGAPLIWLQFEDDFSDGQLDDSSGNGAHALRYGWGTTATNWPTPISPGAPLNLVGANFRPYYDSRPYSSFPTYWDGQYAAVTNVPAPLLTATNFSAMLWARFDDLPAGTNSTDSKDNLATFMNTGWDSVGCWMFGRYYSTTYGEPKFLVVTNAGDLSASYQLSFPQVGQYTNDSWRHYAVTVDCTTPTAPVVKLYTNGVLYATHTLTATIPHLTIADPAGAHPPWIGLSCWTHNTTPELGTDKRPNTGWMHGAMDDIRIYNRVLGPAEIAAIATTGEDPGPVVDATNPRMRGGSLRGGTMR
jgi:hypothetical protein